VINILIDIVDYNKMQLVKIELHRPLPQSELEEVKYKLLGAVSDDADVFLVPSGENYKTCMKVKKEKKLDIKILEIKNIKDAIEKLEKLK
jgi:hypothetical protein